MLSLVLNIMIAQVFQFVNIVLKLNVKIFSGFEMLPAFWKKSAFIYREWILFALLSLLFRTGSV